MASLTSAVEIPTPSSIFKRQELFPKILLAGGLGLLWIILCRHLSAEWSYNEQYNYGWFVPFFALYLFWLRWEDRPNPSQISDEGLRTWASAIAISSLLLLLPLRAIEVANPDWRPISWLHALIVVAITLIIIWQIGGRPWLFHFAFPVAFVLTAVPWPSNVEDPIIQGLMPTVASIAAETLSLFGIPAELQGNLIRIGDSVVGVNEACSGVRSLQTSLMIGLLFGELKRLSILRRGALVICAIAVAFVANCGRAFFLVWIAATRGVEQVQHWHDLAGYAIVVLVFAGCLGLTKLFEDKPSADAIALRDRQPLRLPSISLLLFILAFSLLTEMGTEAWYRMHERNLRPSSQWTVRWPESAPQFREIKIDEQTRRILRQDEGRGATWRARENGADENSPLLPILMYYFRWHPGHNSALLANAHRPDVCLPATGWRQVADFGVRNYAVTDSLSIPFRHFRFSNVTGPSNRFADAFYCVWEDRVRPDGGDSQGQTVLEKPSEWSRSERIQAVLHGRRHLGQQVMEYLQILPTETAPSETEERFAKELHELVRPIASNAKSHEG